MTTTEHKGAVPAAVAPRKDPVRTANYLLYGAIAGICSKTATAPLERLRILQMVEHLHGGEGRYQGILRPLLIIAREEGIRGYWKGNATNVVRIIPTSAARFYTFEIYKTFLRRFVRRDQLNTGEVLLASASAGTTAAVVTFPMDFVRTRLTVQTAGNTYYRGVTNAVLSIYRQEGLLGFYKGVTAAVLNTAPYIAINFTTYEKLKEYTQAGGGSPGTVLSLAMGAIAGTLATTISYPADLIRKRIIVQEMGGKEGTYGGISDAVKKIMREEGPKGFYRGLTATYLKVVPSTAVTWWVIELCRSLSTNP